MNKKNKDVFVLSLVVGLVVEAGRQYVNTVREERVKREKIAEWESEMIAIIRSGGEHVQSLLADRSVPIEEGIKAWREHNEFVELMRLQKPY